MLNVDAQLPPSTTIPVSGWILDHRDVVVDETTTLMHIPEPPVTFPGGEWPWYAQGEISVDPEPAVAGQPAELCAQVVNSDPSQAQLVTLEFSVANFWHRLALLTGRGNGVTGTGRERRNRLRRLGAADARNTGASRPASLANTTLTSSASATWMWTSPCNQACLAL